MVIVIARGQHRSILQNWFQLSCKMSTKLDCSDDKDLPKHFVNSPLYDLSYNYIHIMKTQRKYLPSDCLLLK